MANEGKLFSAKATWGLEDIDLDKLEQRPRNDFDCQRPEQNEYFLKHATKDQQLSVSVTYLLLYRGEQVGFVTITMDEIPLKWKEEIPKGVRFSRLPAVKLAQMGVHKSFGGQGFGKFLVSSVIDKARNLSNEVGCRFVTLDSKTDLVGWYGEQGFKPNEKDNEERQREAEMREKERADKEGREPRQIVLPVSMRFDLHGVS